MIVHVVIGTVGGSYDEWPESVVCGVFTDSKTAEAYVAVEVEKQTAHRRWKDVCHIEHQRGKPDKLRRRRMTEEQFRQEMTIAKAKELDIAGPEPECSPVDYYSPIAIELDVWLRDGTA